MPAYLDPAMLTAIGGAIVGVAAVAGAIFYSIKRKAKSVFKKEDDSDFIPNNSDYDNEDVVDTLSDD